MACYEITGRVTFTSGPFLAGTQLRYIPSGKFGNIYVGPQAAGYSNTLSNSISDNRVPAIAYVDFNASYRVLDKGSRSLEIFGNIKNAFNASPPNAPSNNIGTNANLYDIIGRVFKIGVRFKY